jgi:hypothetical protein
MLLVQILPWTPRRSAPSPRPLQAGYLRNEWRLAGRQHWLDQPPRNFLLAWNGSPLAGYPFVHPTVHTRFSPPQWPQNRAVRTTAPAEVATMGCRACSLLDRSMCHASILREDVVPVDPHTLRLSPVRAETTEAQVSTFPVRRIESVPAAQVDPALRRSKTKQPRKPTSTIRACPAVQTMPFSWSIFLASCISGSNTVWQPCRPSAIANPECCINKKPSPRVAERGPSTAGRRFSRRRRPW